MASMDQIQGLNQALEAIRAEVATLRAVGPALEISLTSAIGEVGLRAMNDITRLRTSVDDLKKTVEDNKSILDKTNELLTNPPPRRNSAHGRHNAQRLRACRAPAAGHAGHHRVRTVAKCTCRTARA